MQADKKFGLSLKKEEGWENYPVQSKSALQDNVYIQSRLENFVSSNEKNKRKVKCLCKPGHDLFFMVKKNSKDKYYVQNYGTNGTHDEGCPFYIGETLFDDKTRKYSSEIFLETDEFENSEVNTQHNEYGETDREARRRLTYYNFCRDLIEDAVLRAFNSVNKGKTNREELENFGNDVFWEKLKYAVNDATKKTIVPEEHDIVHGVISEYNTFFDVLEKNENEDKKYVVTADKYISYENRGLTPTQFSIKHRRLRIAKKLINNLGNDTKTPYFFIGVVQKGGKNSSGKGYRLPYLTRLFVHPIYFDDKNIALVESGYERKYAKRLFEQKIVFLKPMSGNELYKIKRELRNYDYYIDGEVESRAPYLKYRPDFIEFYKDHLLIVEVAGYQWETYKADLEEKSKYYKKLEGMIDIIRYKEVEGRDIE